MTARHARGVIRQAVIDRLIAQVPQVGGRVHNHPVDARTVFPALSVEDAGEQQQRSTVTAGANSIIERQLLIDVVVELKGPGDIVAVRDELLAAVENALLAEPITKVRDIQPRAYQPESSAAEQTLAVGRQRFAITYLTTAADASTAI
jgi:hypothetical protein